MNSSRPREQVRIIINGALGLSQAQLRSPNTRDDHMIRGIIPWAARAVSERKRESYELCIDIETTPSSEPASTAVVCHVMQRGHLLPHQPIAGRLKKQLRKSKMFMFYDLVGAFGYDAYRLKYHRKLDSIDKSPAVSVCQPKVFSTFGPRLAWWRHGKA